MARKEKPVKIIRYKTNRKGNRVRKNKLARIISFILITCLIIGIGYLRAKFLVNSISKKDNGDSSSQSVDLTQSVVINNTSSAENSESESETNYQSTTVVKDRIYYYANTASLLNENSINATISNAKGLGANCIVFDAKDSTGNILYNSNNQYAKQLMSNSVVDIQTFLQKCIENDITPVVRIYTFMDSMISNIERTTAVMYQGTDTRWLDSSLNLGGKPWANPASETMQNYIKDITDELLALGIKEFIFAGFSTPTGYSLDKRDFGASQDQVLASMKSLINTLKAKISAKGGYSAWQIEYSAISTNGNYDHYIVHPYRLGAENIIITANNDIDIMAVANDISQTKPNEIISVALWVNNTNTNIAKDIISNYFVN